MERQPNPHCIAKNSQKPASVETVHGGVPPYGVKETMVVNDKSDYKKQQTDLNGAGRL